MGLYELGSYRTCKFHSSHICLATAITLFLDTANSQGTTRRSLGREGLELMSQVL